MAAGVSSQSNSSTEDDWRIRWQEMEEIVRRLGSKEKSTTDLVDSSSQMADSRKESKGRTILLKIHLLRYSISWEELDCLFARFGRIECIEVFCPGEQYHSRIRFQPKDSAIRAIESFNHRNIYDGCCRMELILEAETDDGFQEPKNRTPPHISEHRQTAASSSESWERRMRMEENLHRMEALVKKLHMEPCRSLVQASTEEEDSVEESVLDEESELTWVDEIADRNQHIDIDSVSKSLSLQQLEDEALESLLVQPESSKAEDLTKASEVENKDDLEVPQIQSNGLEVNPNSCDVVIFDGAVKELAKLVRILIELIEIRLANPREFSWTDLRMSSFDGLRSFGAHKVFVKMPRRRNMVFTALVDGDIQRSGELVLIVGDDMSSSWPAVFDPGGIDRKKFMLVEGIVLAPIVAENTWALDVVCKEISGLFVHQQGSRVAMPYDRGKACMDDLEVQLVFGVVVFDPGGSVAVEFEVFLRKVAVLRTFLGLSLPHCAHNCPAVIKNCCC